MRHGVDEKIGDERSYEMRTALGRSKQCLFCDQSAGNAEHVIAEWLSKRMAIRDLGFQPAHYSETGELERRPLIKCEHLKTKQVCGDCNHGWMSDLEAWAQNHFGPCVEPNATLADFVQLQSIPSEREMIIRWLLKTAIIVERAFPLGPTTKVPMSLYRVARGTQPPTDFWVWAGYIVEPGFGLHLLAGFPVWNGGVLQPFQVHDESLGFAIQLNHLAMQIFRCPDATPTFKLATRLIDQDCPAVPVWLTEPGQFPEPSLPVFPDFDSFRDVLEVTTKPAEQ
ncbi:MAG: hypothetical protein ABIR71_11165 [Chthoniobacterales bacterium]